MVFAFLRGMNLGGRRVTNDELVQVLVEMGLEDVAAYQAAGNLVFTGETTARALEDAFRERFGYDVPVILRSAEVLAAVATAAPFSPQQLAASGGKVQVILLSEEPSQAAAQQALALAGDEDLLKLDGAHLYWLPNRGVGRSELDHKALGRVLGLQTCRTQGTLQRMARKFLA